MFTRKEAKDAVNNSDLAPSCKQVLQNAIWGTYTKTIDDAERGSIKISISKLFKGVDVKERRQYAILETLRAVGLIAYERYAGKITYSLSFRPLQSPDVVRTKPLTAVELGLAMRKAVTIGRARSWAN